MHRGQVIDAYRAFLGLMEDVPNRKAVLAELVFAGLIDVQDSMLFNRSYTTGHKAYRARSTVEIGNAIGWDDPAAHHVLYAGALDIAVGPRWYSTYEMACNMVKMNIEAEALHAVPYGGVSEAELAVLSDNREPLDQEESAGLIEAIIRSQRLGSDERALLILPVSYCFGASVLHTHLYRGGAVVFDSRFMFADKVLRAIAYHSCTSFAGVPTAYQILLRRSNIRAIPLPSLRRFLQAGGALAVASIQQMRTIVPHAEFFVMYGQTEATARISCLPP